MEQQNISEACVQLMQQTDLVDVTTVDEAGCPHTRAMGNLYNLEQFGRLESFFKPLSENFIVYLGTNRKSAKMTHIRTNPNTCLYYRSYTGVHGLALTGSMEVVDDTDIRQTLWQDDWIQFYKGGLAGSDFTVLKVTPVLARGWYKTDKFEFSIAQS